MEGSGAVRLDKWLWAARFFKTRALAVAAISGGHVQLHGSRVKPSKAVAVGDELTITIGRERRTVTVVRLSDRRGPASVAATLYRESEESRLARQRAAELRRLAPPPAPGWQGGRPTKRDRRRYEAASDRRRRADR